MLRGDVLYLRAVTVEDIVVHIVRYFDHCDNGGIRVYVSVCVCIYNNCVGCVCVYVCMMIVAYVCVHVCVCV